jgi:hypothetical protein
MTYSDSIWNTADTDAYIDKAPNVNIIFKSGTVKKAVQDTLRSDMAYFIQQHDGRFTIRRWGMRYNYRDINSWIITKSPEKTFPKQENYFSSCIIKLSGDNQMLYNGMEYEAQDKYRKLKRKEFETNLADINDGKQLAELLSSRYSIERQTIKISLGIDTSDIELLDIIYLDMTINKRMFSKAKTWIVKGIDPAQDILTLEETEGTGGEGIWIIDGGYPDTGDNYDFTMDGGYPDTTDYELTLDGEYVT